MEDFFMDGYEEISTKLCAQEDFNYSDALNE